MTPPEPRMYTAQELGEAVRESIIAFRNAEVPERPTIIFGHENFQEVISKWDAKYRE